MTTVRVGIAAWANPPAQQAVRRAGESHLQHYASRFNCVEINSSFYRAHQRSTYERWRESTANGFRFSVKAPRSVSHESALKHCRSELREFLYQVAGLGRKLRVMLLQTPASLEFEQRTVARFLATLTAASPCKIAWEARHPSWFSPTARAMLARYDIARVVADPARGSHEPTTGGGLVYYRLHGSPRMYYSAYSAAYLQRLRNEIVGLQVKEAWCIFDNTARHASWDNAVYLQELLSSDR
jgi:uncharacterized protein YecE (DUF72 family)